MRGLAAHSNGFQTDPRAGDPHVAARHDRPARRLSSSRALPRAVPPNARPPKGPQAVQPNTPLDGAPLGWPEGPDDLFVDEHGEPVRIDKGFSWEYPLAAHGLMHNVITNAWRGDPYPIDTLFLFMANMAWNSSMNTVAVRKMLVDKHADGEKRRVQDSVPGRLRRVRVGDDGVRRPDPARHHVPRAARRHVAARPADLGVRRSGRFGARSGGAAHRPVQAVPGRADRAREPARVSRVRQRRRLAQVPRLSRLHRPLRDGAGLGHRLSRRLARQERRAFAARRAQPEAVGDVREEQLRVPVSPAAQPAVHAQLEPRLPAVGAADGPAPRLRPDRHPHLLRIPAALPPGGAGQASRQAAAGPVARARRHLLRSAAVLVRVARDRADRHRALSAARRHPAADGDVPLVGFAERVAAPDPRAQLPDGESAHGAGRGHRRRRLAVGRIALGQGARHVPLYRSGRARHGVDLERDRQGERRVAPRARRQRIAPGLPAQSPHHRGIARRRWRERRDDLQLRPDHRTGGVVRRARAHLSGGRGRAGGDVAAIRAGGGDAGPARATSGVARVFRGQGARDDDATRAGHRPQRVRGLPRLRHELQGVEHVGLGRAARRPRSVRQRPQRHVLQSRADLRGRRVSEHPDGALSQVVPALRGPAVRSGVSHGSELQARRGRHRAGRLRQVHRLQLLRLGVSLRCARAGRKAQGDDQVHAVRRPHPRQGAARARSPAGLRARVPDQRAALRRHPRSGVGGVARRSASRPAMR